MERANQTGQRQPVGDRPLAGLDRVDVVEEPVPDHVLGVHRRYRFEHGQAVERRALVRSAAAVRLGEDCGGQEWEVDLQGIDTLVARAGQALDGVGVDHRGNGFAGRDGGAAARAGHTCQKRDECRSAAPAIRYSIHTQTRSRSSYPHSFRRAQLGTIADRIPLRAIAKSYRP